VGPEVVREFHEADRARVVDLWGRVFPDDKPRNAPGPMLDRKLAMGDGLVWVAEADGVVIGVVMAGYDGVRGWIYHLAVDEACRRRGIASALMRAAESELARRGCPKVNLQVMGDNSSVVALYERLGYAVEDRLSLGKVLDEG
jgi:ribosomal protein S18 acetylase RimI-like enzyme